MTFTRFMVFSPLRSDDRAIAEPSYSAPPPTPVNAKLRPAFVHKVAGMNYLRLAPYAFLLALQLGLAPFAVAQVKGEQPSAPAAAKMRAAAEQLLAVLPEKSRAQAMRPFE